MGEIQEGFPGGLIPQDLGRFCARLMRWVLVDLIVTAAEDGMKTDVLLQILEVHIAHGLLQEAS